MDLTSFSNEGLLEKTGGTGISQLTGPFTNTGTILVSTGVLEISSLSGPGACVIAGGTLSLNSRDANVTFSGTSGVFALASSRTYAGTVSGFSTAGGTALDLTDIKFRSPAEASFSGTTTSGVLTVTDGIHTAHITLIGDYTGSTFVASRDGSGGTLVVDPASGKAASAHRFIAAAAGLGSPAGEAIHAGAALAGHAPMLVTPHAMIT